MQRLFIRNTASTKGIFILIILQAFSLTLSSGLLFAHNICRSLGEILVCSKNMADFRKRFSVRRTFVAAWACHSIS